MHPLFFEADILSREVIGAAIDVQRHLGPGLMESIYERCLLRELDPRKLPTKNQHAVKIEYKGLIFEEQLRCDLLVKGCLLVELKSVQEVIPVHKAMS